MIRRGIPALVGVLVLLPVLAGCTSESDKAVDTAQRFWQAMQDRDLEEARLHATRASGRNLEINEGGEDQEICITFGTLVEKNGEASVPTTLEAKDDRGDMTIPLETILVREDGDWKVDADRTAKSMLQGAMAVIVGSALGGTTTNAGDDAAAGSHASTVAEER